MLRSLTVRYAIAFMIGAMLGIGFLLSAVAANADTASSQISIGQNGFAMVRNAHIVSIEGGIIESVAGWGDTEMRFRVITTGSTRFIPQMPSKDMPKTFKVGDIVAFSGTLDMGSGEPTVYASSVKDENLVQSATRVMGSVVGTDGASLIVATENGTSSVQVGTGTIMTLDGNRVAVKRLRTGDSVIAFGTLDMVRGVLSAERVMVASVTPSQEGPGIPNTGTVTSGGIFSGIWKWIGVRDIFSVR